MKSIFIILLFMVSLSASFAQPNNPIFAGGNNDGFNMAAFAQSGNSIFTGGNGDGWNRMAYQQTAVNIFNGGNNDGWAAATFLQAGNNIFTGSNGDGWNNTSFLQAGNAIFNGGNGDGWSVDTALQAGNDIYKGGIGDGWSSTYRPMGTIPVNFLYFNARKEGDRSALLNWKTSQEVNSAWFDVERSIDAVNFNFIGKVNAAGNSQIPVDYYFTDNQPVKGTNYYRLKQVDLDGHFIYTPARLVRFDDMGAGIVKYYPNPTNGILNIELPISLQSGEKVVNITNLAGIVLNQFRLENNTNPLLKVDLSKYPRGVYFVQVKTATVNSIQRVVLQ